MNDGDIQDSGIKKVTLENTLNAAACNANIPHV